MSNELIKKMKKRIIAAICIFLFFSCRQQQIPNGIYKGKIEKYTYQFDFRDDYSVLLKKYDTLSAGILKIRIGSYDDIIEKYEGIWEFDDNYIKVLINDEAKSEMSFSFDRNDLVERNSKERFIKEIIN